MIIKIGPIGSKLIFWGAALFLIGLIQGGLIPYFMNTRMALSAHLAAVQSGMALMIFGIIFELISLKEKSDDDLQRLQVEFDVEQKEAEIDLLSIEKTLAEFSGPKSIAKFCPPILKANISPCC